MFRLPNLMKEKEREIDYLSRLSVNPRCTLKSVTEIQHILVDFIMRNNLELNGQTGKRYVTFREHGFNESFIGGFGSLHQISHIIIDKTFNIKEQFDTNFVNIIKLYDKIDVDVQLTQECVTFSLKKIIQNLKMLNTLSLSIMPVFISTKDFIQNQRSLLDITLMELNLRSQ